MAYVEIDKTKEKFEDIEYDMIRLDVKLDNLEVRLVKLMNDIKEAVSRGD